MVSFDEIINWIHKNKQWIFDGFGVAILMSIIGWLIRRHRTKSIKIGGDSIGHDKIDISGDYIAGDKVTTIVMQQKPQLDNHFKIGYVVFGATPHGLVVPKGLVPKGFKINWATGQILVATNDYIEILLPDMIINTSTLNSNKVVVPRIIGAKLSLLEIGKINIQLEVIGIDNQMIVVAIGFI